MNDNYITIKEYAKRKGIKLVEAYAEIGNDDLKPFVAIRNGIKVISIEALPAQEKPIEEEARPVPAEGQIAELEAQIRHLEGLIRQKDEKITELSLKLAELAEASQKISENALNVVNQAQILHAIDKQEKKGFFRRLLEGKKTNDERL